ncbi:MAG: VPLPA-CTERM sorting domain-containing protein [Desulfuromonadales bacterium]
MNLSQKTSLSLLFVSLSAVSANAALSIDNEGAEIAIEKTAQNTSLQPLDQLLGGGNHADLFGTVLKQHAESAQPAKSTMEGHFERDGSQQPTGLAEQLISAPAPESAQAPNLSLTASVHLGAQAETTPATATSTGSSTPVSSATLQAASVNFTTTITPNANPVPLPAAGLLLASGLIGMTGLRKRQRQE